MKDTKLRDMMLQSSSLRFKKHSKVLRRIDVDSAAVQVMADYVIETYSGCWWDLHSKCKQMGPEFVLFHLATGLKPLYSYHLRANWWNARNGCDRVYGLEQIAAVVTSLKDELAVRDFPLDGTQIRER